MPYISASLGMNSKTAPDDSPSIEKAVIPQHPFISVYDPKNLAEAVQIAAGMVLHLIGDDFRTIHPKDADLILNDGILNRMRIRIELSR
jgi:hypothetical protein